MWLLPRREGRAGSKNVADVMQPVVEAIKIRSQSSTIYLQNPPFELNVRMKKPMLRLLDRVTERVGRGITKSLSLKREFGKSFDITEVAYLRAAIDSADYYTDQLVTAQTVESDLALLAKAASMAKPDGLWLEFGVAYGRSIRHIATLRSGPIFGFDSFEGLPERWRTGFDKGAFACNLPAVPANVQLIKGLFAETIPPFLASHHDNIAFLHIDCDLYSSTKTIFELFGSRLILGSVIVFDDYWNYPGWQQHGHKAFLEFAKTEKRAYFYDSFVPNEEQVCVVLT